MSESFPRALTKEETIEYCKLIKEGSIEAKEKMQRHNLRLVAYRVKKRFHNTDFEYEELISIGTIGLIKAINTFDIDKNIVFATYAVRCIDNEILMSFRETKKHNKNISIDEPVTNPENKSDTTLTYADFLTSEENFVEDIVTKEALIEIRESLSILNPLELEIIQMYYGFNGKSLNQYEISKIIGYEQSYISRILKVSRNKIKHHMESKEIIQKPKILCKKKNNK
ncbi:MAG: sigma-70 family RNA polymerase sigma factor [Bacilli bacterium]|nr:sigma-70 family RNA polymerase sigma factor [Bacilli bacterium]